MRQGITENDSKKLVKDDIHIYSKKIHEILNCDTSHN